MEMNGAPNKSKNVKLFTENNRINSIRSNPEYRSVKMINEYDNMDNIEISHSKVLSACK